MSCEHQKLLCLAGTAWYRCSDCGHVGQIFLLVDDLRTRLATAERDLEEAQRDAVAETIRRETAERERDEAIAACQQKHGVHPSWVNAVDRMRKERDEAREQLKVALRMLEVHARAGCPQAAEDAVRIRGDNR